MPATTGSPNEYALIATTIDPAVLDLITTWLAQVGYEVEQLSYLSLSEQDLVGRDAVVLSCGSNGAGAGPRAMPDRSVTGQPCAAHISMTNGISGAPVFAKTGVICTRKP